MSEQDNNWPDHLTSCAVERCKNNVGHRCKGSHIPQIAADGTCLSFEGVDGSVDSTPPGIKLIGTCDGGSPCEHGEFDDKGYGFCRKNIGGPAKGTDRKNFGCSYWTEREVKG